MIPAAFSRSLLSVCGGLGLLLITQVLLALPAAAQTGLAEHDSTLPIEIAADQLTVEQANRRAVFSGNVEAVQGEVTLRADRLIAYYELESGAPTSGAIRRVEAEGNVVIASPQESARAERAVYDVVAGTILLEGAVILARGEDMVRGPRLDIDLRRQTAVMRAAGDERVRALFRSQTARAQGSGG